MIFIGAFYIIVSGVCLFSVGMTGATARTAKDFYELNMAYALTFISFLRAVIELVAGIIGVINAEKNKKAKTCIIWSILVSVMCVVCYIFNVIDILSFATGLIPPVLYIIGAYKNQQKQV